MPVMSLYSRFLQFLLLRHDYSILYFFFRLYMLILFSSFCCYGGLTMVGSVIVFYSFEAHCFLILLVLLLTIRNTVFAYRDETSSKN